MNKTVSPQTSIWLKWIIANTISFAIGGVLFRFWSPGIVILGGVIGLLCTPLLIISLAFEKITLAPFIVGGAITGSLLGLLLGGCSSVAQRLSISPTIKLSDDWFLQSMLGGLWAGAATGAIAGLVFFILTPTLTLVPLGLPLDWAFQPSLASSFILTFPGAIAGAYLGYRQYRVLWKQGHEAKQWIIISSISWALGWAIASLAGETISSIIGLSLAYASLTITYNQPLITNYLSRQLVLGGITLAIVGLTYGMITFIPLQKIVNSQASTPYYEKNVEYLIKLYFKVCSP